jgi:hypothetical protein
MAAESNQDAPAAAAQEGNAAEEVWQRAGRKTALGVTEVKKPVAGTVCHQQDDEADGAKAQIASYAAGDNGRMSACHSGTPFNPLRICSR